MKLLRLEDAIFKQEVASCRWSWPAFYVSFVKSGHPMHSMRVYMHRVNQQPHIMFRLDGEGSPEVYWSHITSTLFNYGIICEPLKDSVAEAYLPLPNMEMT